MAIHPSALIDAQARLGADVDVGPFSVVGPGCVVGDGTRIGPHVVLERDVQLGSQCAVSPGAVLGGEPQDLKYAGEAAPVVIGDRTVIRESVTVNRGTAAHGRTEIGSDCLIMAYAHIAHDCIIGNHVVIANAVQMGGHVEIEDWAIVGGLTAIHQFARVGAHAMVGGASAVRKDVPPYVKASGHPLRVIGLNAVGLRRRGFADDAQRSLRQAHRLLFQSKLNVSQALERIRADVAPSDVVQHLIDFVEHSRRGIAI